MEEKIRRRAGAEKILCPMTDVEAAAYLGVATQTVRNWRHIRRGPAYHKVGGRRIIYLEEDLKAFLEKSRIDPENFASACGK